FSGGSGVGGAIPGAGGGVGFTWPTYITVPTRGQPLTEQRFLYGLPTRSAGIAACRFPPPDPFENEPVEPNWFTCRPESAVELGLLLFPGRLNAVEPL